MAVEVKVFECGCQLAWDASGPQAAHVSNRCPALPAGQLTPSTWDGKMRQFFQAHKGYLRSGRWVWRR